VTVRAGWAVAAGGVLLAAGCLGLAGWALRLTPGPQTLELRVVAASDRPADQAVKLQVRDAVLAALAPGLAGIGDAAAARRYVAARLPAVRAVAAAVAGRAGESATVDLRTEAFPVRRIGLVRFAAGPAPALVVTLGPGAGHNWFTVLFPPLALVTVDGALVAVGPGDGAASVRDLTPAERRALLQWVQEVTGVPLDPAVSAGDPGGAPGAEVQLRLALWDLLQALPWQPVRDAVLAWLDGTGAGVRGWL
jgi:stage II sporulation protein R